MTQLAEPHTMLWTRELYYAAAEGGAFNQKRVELIEGEIIEMSPMSSKHGMVIYLVQKGLERVFRDGYLVVAQAPLDLGETSEPQPDIAVYAGSAFDYLDAKPTHALLVVEVADSSLRYDRGQKASLYAKANIEDYWIINLKDDTLEIYRTPVAAPTQPYGYGYKMVSSLKAQDTISPLAAPQAHISVGELLATSRND
jgi:Uma2 family endonuclease